MRFVVFCGFYPPIVVDLEWPAGATFLVRIRRKKKYRKISEKIYIYTVKQVY